MSLRGVYVAWSALLGTSFALTFTASCTSTEDDAGDSENEGGGAGAESAGRDAGRNEGGDGPGPGDGGTNGESGQGTALSGAGGVTSGGSSGSGASAGLGFGGSLIIPTPGAACEEGFSACIGRAASLLLTCRGGALVLTHCERDERCDSARAECVAVIPECLQVRAGGSFCADEVTRSVCGPDLVDTREETCDGRCEAGRCVALTCGDGTVQDDEECDDANDLDTDDCAACVSNVCGDRIIDREPPVVEECDDGRATAKCTEVCTRTRCGDQRVSALAGEQCEPNNSYEGVLLDSVECDADCTLPICGDAHQNAATGEWCDDGELNGQYGHCRSDCTDLGPHCGDSRVTDGESCDFGVENSDEGYNSCRTDCTGIAHFCGDGTIDTKFGETCDDGNLNNLDGCSNGCRYLFVPEPP